MKRIRLYSFHKGISPDRFDGNNTKYLLEKLSETYNVEWKDLRGDSTVVHEGVPISHGSILIFEDPETGKFKTYDFGDSPKITVQLSKSALFDGAAIGQYNATFWDSIVPDPEVRRKVQPGPYPETYWNLGVQNYEAFKEYRKAIQLDSRLYWRGSLYNSGVPEEYLGVRKAIELLPDLTAPEELYFGLYPISFDQYLQEAVRFKLVLSIGGGGGCVCGDFCFRDIEMYGLGIPTIRPVYAVTAVQPLIPDVHYISVPAEFDNTYRYRKPEQLARDILKRYREVIQDRDYLDEVASNARNWYLQNITYPNITNLIINSLNL